MVKQNNRGGRGGGTVKTVAGKQHQEAGQDEEDEEEEEVGEEHVGELYVEDEVG